MPVLDFKLNDRSDLRVDDTDSVDLWVVSLERADRSLSHILDVNTEYGQLSMHPKGFTALPAEMVERRVEETMEVLTASHGVFSALLIRSYPIDAVDAKVYRFPLAVVQFTRYNGYRLTLPVE